MNIYKLLSYLDTFNFLFYTLFILYTIIFVPNYWLQLGIVIIVSLAVITLKVMTIEERLMYRLDKMIELITKRL